MAWIWRILIMITAPITALFVSRDALNFSVIETFVVVILIVGLVSVAAGWTLRRPPRDPF